MVIPLSYISIKENQDFDDIFQTRPLFRLYETEMLIRTLPKDFLHKFRECMLNFKVNFIQSFVVPDNYNHGDL